jgi:ParB family chromosome partitioning protein
MTSKGLGKGLGALLGEESTKPNQERGVTMIPISHIEPNVSQPRRIFDDQALNELSESIRLHGILQPLAVRRLSTGYFQIIAGERRWRASKLAGLTELPVIILEADDRRTMELSLIENLQREDLNPIEEAEGFRSLIEEFGLKQEEAASRVGRSRSALANTLRLLTLPDDIKSLVSKGELSEGHARALLQLPTKKSMSDAAARIIEKALSVRETEAYIKKLLLDADKEPESLPDKPNYLLDVEKRLSSCLGRKVRIVSGRGKGRFELEFYGNDDLERLISALESLST